METIQRSRQSAVGPEAGDGPEPGANLAELQSSTGRLADAADEALGQALGNTDVDEFMETSKRLTGGE